MCCTPVDFVVPLDLNFMFPLYPDSELASIAKRGGGRMRGGRALANQTPFWHMIVFPECDMQQNAVISDTRLKKNSVLHSFGQKRLSAVI
jgi:hypothetical protein